MNVVSQVLRQPIINWLVKSEISKKQLSQALGVSRQTPTDWTKEKATPVTPENAVRMAEFADDSELTMSIIYQFFGIFRPLDGDTYRRDLSSSDDLRELEENERDKAKVIAQRVLLKRVQKLNSDDFDLLLKFSKEQAEAVFANIQYLNALCEIQNISIMDLFDIFMKDWQDAGYFGGD
ncbi:helix-turn-helix transcriptional regulator [Enterococcus malodoratus]|uniref:Uncharacterized protein n=1 Tax=Enterococcus malodoratus ATCC 43197 TaxID=1158601 RepID=R2RAL7_9ENTE|nr:helix-turn-helix transcriptional regulator [Enterococcus malodoratus]EOH80755.1 hypothetical protein UAI_00795 [Enterococcus malodoratus ATCC 43197]EOT69264.1 hypothetical protein I585_00726 [Enterococcus malodoratus ATCC 43197]OJG63273.1 hypothetical protein RV07_GL001017 [Enterococcus malodoratus]SPW68395.1 Uncharacterised protein [Enterococcus malodoratus]STC71382.1 Uncharacterised protein [Enterococcus malodoratus]